MTQQIYKHWYFNKLYRIIRIRNLIYRERYFIVLDNKNRALRRDGTFSKKIVWNTLKWDFKDGCKNHLRLYKPEIYNRLKI